MAPTDPKVMSLALNMHNPNIYLRWGITGPDPRLWSMLSAGLNPNWFTAWMNTMANPGSYGPTVGGRMQSPYGGAVKPPPCSAAGLSVHAAHAYAAAVTILPHGRL